MTSATKRGSFIVIEGLDRSGKTTQTARLQSALESNGVKTCLMKFPDRTTPIGKMIDAYLRSESELDDRAIHLMFSANRWEAVSKILSLLNSGITIICDRYAFSGIAFSTAKNPSIPPESLNTPLSYLWCRVPDTGLPAPDLTIFLDISPEKARERGGYGEERYEKEEMQRGVRDVFKRIGKEMRDEKDCDEKWVEIDAGREIEIVEEEIWKVVQKVVNGGKSDLPVTNLWQS